MGKKYDGQWWEGGKPVESWDQDDSWKSKSDDSWKNKSWKNDGWKKDSWSNWDQEAWEKRSWSKRLLDEFSDEEREETGEDRVRRQLDHMNKCGEYLNNINVKKVMQL